MARQPMKGKGRGRAPRGPRRNERVRAPEVRVIGPDGKQAGIMTSKEAFEMAKQYGLDLVEVSPSARPPVCRILDYGKYQYEQSKREKESKSAANKLKEVKFRVRIDRHDYETKLRNGERFLGQGSKLKLTLMFRGREMEHQELGFEVIKRAIHDLQGMGTLDSPPKLVGRNITCTLSPLPASKQKPKFYVESEHGDDEEEDDDED